METDFETFKQESIHKIERNRDNLSCVIVELKYAKSNIEICNIMFRSERFMERRMK